MKWLRMTLVCGCILAVSAWAFAGDWSFSWSFGAGHPAGWDGRPSHHPGAWYPPVYYPTSWVYVTGSNWGWSSYYGSGYGWGGYYPYGWRPYRPYRRAWWTPIYVMQPWPVGTVTVIDAASYGGDYDDYVDPPRASGNEVFMVPVNAPPRAAADRPDGIRAPLYQPSAAPMGDARSLAARPRRDLDGISRVFRLGGIERAETELGKLLRANPSDAEVSYDYAYVLFLREKYAMASWCLRRGLVLDAKMAATGAAAVSAFHDAKASADALARLDGYLVSEPTDDAARLLRAWALFLDGRQDAACTELDRVIAAHPDDAQAAALRAFCAPAEPAR